MQNDFIWWNDAAIKPRRFQQEQLLWASRSCQALEMDMLYSHIVKKYMHLSFFKAASDGIWGENRGSTGHPEFCWQLNKIFIVCVNVEGAYSKKMMHHILHKETLNEATVKKRKRIFIVCVSLFCFSHTHAHTPIPRINMPHNMKSQIKIKKTHV